MLHRHGYGTDLEMIMSAPQPDGDTQAGLLDALCVCRVVEQILSELQAAAEPPTIVTALQFRRDRIYRGPAELLGCDRLATPTAPGPDPSPRSTSLAAEPRPVG